MIGTIVEVVNHNQLILNSIAGFISGVCMLYVVLSRTVRKRRNEQMEAPA